MYSIEGFDGDGNTGIGWVGGMSYAESQDTFLRYSYLLDMSQIDYFCTEFGTYTDDSDTFYVKHYGGIFSYGALT